MTAPEPLGPALAAELGGEWAETLEEVCLPGGNIECHADGSVWAQTDDAPIRLGSFSDGAPALARRARRLGVA